MKKTITQLGVAALLASGLALPAAATADAAPKPVTYKNCTALNKVYPHGVKKAKTTMDRTSNGKVKRSLAAVDAKTYALNAKSDRDKDGIACEK